MYIYPMSSIYYKSDGRRQGRVRAAGAHIALLTSTIIVYGMRTGRRTVVAR